MPKFLTNVKETTATTGTGTLDLDGALTGFFGFLDQASSGDEVYYAIIDDPDNPTEYEAGIGTITAGTPNTLSRDTVIVSTNGGSKVSWSSGTKVVIAAPNHIALGGEGPLAPRRLLRGYIDGLNISVGSDADHDIDISVGVAMADDDSALMELDTAITKELDSSFVAGDGNGGFASGESLPTSGTIHIWLIRRSDTGAVDVFANNHAASGLSPTLPTNYDQKRRIGSRLTDGSDNIVPCLQRGNLVLHDVPQGDVSGTNPGTAQQVHSLSVPKGFAVRPIFSYKVRDPSPPNTTAVLITSPDQTNTAPTTQNGQLYWLTADSGMFEVTVDHLWSDDLGRLRVRHSQSDAGVVYTGTTHGWIDDRGRDA